MPGCVRGGARQLQSLLSSNAFVTAQDLCTAVHGRCPGGARAVHGRCTDMPGHPHSGAGTSPSPTTRSCLPKGGIHVPTEGQGWGGPGRGPHKAGVPEEFNRPRNSISEPETGADGVFLVTRTIDPRWGEDEIGSGP